MTHSDHGTVLKPDEAAIVFTPGEGFSLLMPDFPDDVEVPMEVLLLAAFTVKSSDSEWVAAMIDELKSAPSN